jgi:hypothetical protein
MFPAAGNSVKGCVEHKAPVLHNTYKTDIGDAVTLDATKLLDDFLVQLTVSRKAEKSSLHLGQIGVNSVIVTIYFSIYFMFLFYY